MKSLFFILFFASIILSCQSPKADTEAKALADSPIGNNIPVDTIDSIPVISYSNQLPEYLALAIDTELCGLEFKAKGNYSLLKNEIETQRQNFLQKLEEIKDSLLLPTLFDTVQNYFNKALLNQIVPHWYDTPWSFEGHSSRPGKGEIACGYFVSTTLQHLGFNLNRYRLAQQSPYNEALSLAINKDNIIHLSNQENNIFNQLANFEDGLYFVGLDNHVGYLLLRDRQPYFIHSNYIFGYVMTELAHQSDAFYSTEYFFVRLDNHTELMKKWISGEDIIIQKKQQ